MAIHSKRLPLSIQDVKAVYNRDKNRIKRRLNEFKRIRPDDYFYELVYCLLTPQSSAVNADLVVDSLKKKNFQTKNVKPERFLSSKDSYIRFHKNKSKYLFEMKNKYDAIFSQLGSGSPASVIREWLVKNVKGIGYKEASHFLRNIGYRNLAILDRHILKNLVRIGVLKELPKSLTKKMYFEIEKKFLKFSKKINIPIDELDLLFWSMETGEILK
jgi:N-glycosylase/DNA lyase